MKARGLVLFAGLTFASIGCGDSGVTLAKLPAARAQAVCAQNFKCCSAADLMDEADVDTGEPITQQQCVMNIKGAWELAVIPSISDGQAKGRVTYDQAKAEACIAAIKAMSCDDWNNGLKQPPECAQAFVAKVAAGGKCGSDFDCVDGVCVGADSSTTPPTDGVCQAKVAAGAACMSIDLISDNCADGSYCGPGDVCVAKKPGGTACGGDDECGSDNCNTTAGTCSGYLTCGVAGPVTTRTTLVSLAGLALVLGALRRRRRKGLSR
jgi:hypothetical protein